MYLYFTSIFQKQILQTNTWELTFVPLKGLLLLLLRSDNVVELHQVLDGLRRRAQQPGDVALLVRTQLQVGCGALVEIDVRIRTAKKLGNLNINCFYEHVGAYKKMCKNVEKVALP